MDRGLLVAVVEYPCRIEGWLRQRLHADEECFDDARVAAGVGGPQGATRIG